MKATKLIGLLMLVALLSCTVERYFIITTPIAPKEPGRVHIITPREPFLHDGISKRDFRQGIDSALIDQQLQIDSLKAITR
jgi:hypothetical protein